MSKETHLRILIIDDNPDIHKDFKRVLLTDPQSPKKLDQYAAELFGQTQTEKATLPKFQIDTATQGQEGVECIKKAVEDGYPYALAFVDIRMPPGWDGIETIKHIWKIDSDIQVVICSAYSDYSWEDTIEHLGQRENLLILNKPFDNIAVRQLASALTKKWQLIQSSREYTNALEKSVKERTFSLQQSLSISRGTLESSADGIIVTDATNQIIDYNSKIIEMWNIPPVLLENKDAESILEYIDTQIEESINFLEMAKNILHKPDIVKIDKLKCKDQKVFEHYSQPYRLDNIIGGRIWSFRDITKRAMLEEKIEYQASHDALTNLPNRVFLIDKIRKAIEESKENNWKFGILFFDIDRFKLINDSYNHLVGDELLQAVSHRLQLSMRTNDILSRLGGDEFVAIISALKTTENLDSIAHKLLNTFINPFKVTSHEIIISSSIGISIFPEDGNDVDELIRNADTAMYRAKELGGNQFQYYNVELSKRSIMRMEMEYDLRRAIENNEFFLNFQPQIRMPGHKLLSVEALIRWNHPKKGIISPVDFIPLAEETGLIIPITEWLLREACKQNKCWQEMGLPKIRMAVNITSHQFKQPDLVDKILKILKDTGLAPEYLEIELTENVIINNIESERVISQLRESGIYIALDDFGSGYSALNYLRKIHVDRIKIDQSFIQNINRNSDDEVIIQAIITMAQHMKLEVLAEGVETKEQLDFLKAKDIDEIQGFYFSKPLTGEDLVALLNDLSKLEELKK